MNQNPDDLKMLLDKYKNMNSEEIKANINHWENNVDFCSQLPCHDIAKNELELKYKERQVQIELLTKSLTSSSRLGRWISSIKGIFNQFLETRD